MVNDVRRGALILLSGGLDSTVLLASAVKEFGAENVNALTLFYGQKHDKELESAKAVARHYKVWHIVENMAEVFRFSNASLLKPSTEDVPKGDYEIQRAELGEGSIVSTYVPFRNGLFLSYATALAFSLKLSHVGYGAHANDHASASYPDCSPAFFQAQAEAVNQGTAGAVRLVAPMLDLTKSDIVRLGLELEAPLHLTWSCYEGREKACGGCATCVERLNAFEAAGGKDVIEYE